MARRKDKDILPVTDAEKRAAHAAINITAIREPLLLMASSGLRIPDQELARMLGIAPNNVFLWRTGRQAIPRKHLPPLAALLVITWAKSRVQAQVLNSGSDVLAEFDAIRRFIDTAVQPVLQDRELYEQYKRLVHGMLEALSSAEGQRILAAEVEALVKQLVAAKKAH